MPTNSCGTRHQTHTSTPGSGIAGMRNGEGLQTTLGSRSPSSCQMISLVPNFCTSSGQHSTYQIRRGPICVLHERMGLKDSDECECGHREQIMHHIIEDCPLYQPPNGERGLVTQDDDTRSWLASTKLEI